MGITCEADIECVVQSVFSTMLQIDVVRVDLPPGSSQDYLFSAVQIYGAWEGCVVLGMFPEVASVASSVMFKIPAAESTDIDRQEVAAELANMVGGNIKSLLPGPSFLSLPTIMHGCDVDQMLDAELIEQSMFMSEEGPIQVRIFAAS